MPHPSNAPSWDFPRVPLAARMIVETGRAHGVPEHELLAGTTLTIETLRDGQRLVEADEELTLARNLVHILGNHVGLGMEAVRHYNLGSLGILGFAVIASPTMREALALCVRYVSLSSAFIKLSVEQGKDEALVLFEDYEIPEDVREFLVERDLAAIGQILPSVLGEDLPQALVRLELRMDQVRGDLLSAQFPLSDIRFGMPRNVAVFSADLLDLPLPQADAETAELCERQCHDLLDRRRQRHGTAGAVRTRLLRTPAQPPSMQVVAGELNVDPRTLRRHLDSEGTSFRALVTEVRETLAIELLSNTGLTVEQVAARLGYADTASFTHAFTRWRGHPPSHSRRG